jgi:hypothetical protein
VTANFGNCKRFGCENESYSAAASVLRYLRRPRQSAFDILHHHKKAGTKTGESIVHTSSPPMTQSPWASGTRRQRQEPALLNIPPAMAIVVMMVGRAPIVSGIDNSFHARDSAPHLDHCKIHRLIAFFVTMSISIKKPMKTGKPIDRAVRSRANIAPPMNREKDNDWL